MSCRSEVAKGITKSSQHTTTVLGQRRKSPLFPPQKKKPLAGGRRYCLNKSLDLREREKCWTMSFWDSIDNSSHCQQKRAGQGRRGKKALKRKISAFVNSFPSSLEGDQVINRSCSSFTFFCALSAVGGKREMVVAEPE